MGNTKKNTLTEGSIAKGMIAFAIPVFLGQLFQQLYNIADSLIVGNTLGNEALAAVTSTGSLIFLLIGFFQGTAIGAGVVIARYFGAKDEQRMRRAIHTDLAFGVICGVILTVVGVIFTPSILKLMGTPKDVFGQSVAYLRVYFFGSGAVVLYNICTGILQAVGDSKHPLYYLIVSSCTNVVLDLIFCGWMKGGVEYAALATVISQLLSVVLCMYRLVHVKEAYRVELKKIGIDKLMIKEIIKIGLPTGFQNSIISLANVVVQSNINSFGKMAMAGCGSYSKLEGFAFLPVTCFSISLTTFVGQNIGAKQYERVKKGAKFGILCAVGLAELIGVILFIFGPHFISLFGGSAEAISYGTRQIRAESLFYFLLAFSHAASAVLRGAGKSMVPMVVMLVAWCGIRISYITITAKLFHNILFVFSAYPLTWSISSVIFLFYLFKTKWMVPFDGERRKETR